MLERNIYAGISGAKGVLLSAVNATLRDNVFDSSSSNTGSRYGAQIAQRANEPVPEYVEFYNNTCYAIASIGACAGFDGTNYGAPGINSWARNNLFYNNGSNNSAIANNGTGNTISNNTTNSGMNPGMINASGSFSSPRLPAHCQLLRRHERAGVVRCARQPRSPAWNLGAIHQ